MIVVTGHMGFVGRHLLLALMHHDKIILGADLKNGNDVLDCDLPDAERVYHLAACTDATSTDIEHVMRTNVVGTARLLERYGDRLVLASSSMVNYPVTPYAISKLACEHMARMCGAAVVRLCNLYGEGGHSAIDRFERDEVLTIFGDGTQRRTYASVDRAVHLLLTAQSGATSVLEGVNLSVNDVAARHPTKERVRAPRHPLDVIEGVQL